MAACLRRWRPDDIPIVDITGGRPGDEPALPLAGRPRSAALGRTSSTAATSRSCWPPRLAGPARVPGRASGRDRRLAPLLPRREHRRPARRGRLRDARSRPCAGSTRSATAGQGSGLALNLVYNPIGPRFLPAAGGARGRLTAASSRRATASSSTASITITNMPISRFLEILLRTGQYERVHGDAVGAFNPAAAAGVMCRTTLSVGWDGRLYDCDFNQMLELPAGPGPAAAHPTTSTRDRLGRAADRDRPALLRLHRRRGSSCQGAIAS